VTRIATTPDEILSSSMLPYLWTPVLSQLNEAIFQRGLTRLAIVGTPCVAEGARRLMTSSHERLWPYREAIRLAISSFCSGVYMPHVIDELLDRGLGIRRQQIRSLSTRAGDGMLLVALWDGTERAVPLTEVEPFTRAGCGSCDDYLGESADLAVGAIGAPDGHAALIVRTDEGQHFVRCAVSAALLEVGDGVDLGALHAAKTEKDRRARAQALDDVRILMLDALQDAGKREKVRKEFAHLCGASPAGTKKEEVGCGHCNGC
jgi:coenzyme F420 hydrogenase subunit beta